MGSSLSKSSYIAEEDYFGPEIGQGLTAKTDDKEIVEKESKSPHIGNANDSGRVFYKFVTKAEDPTLVKPHEHYYILIDSYVVLEKLYKKNKLELRSVLKSYAELYKSATDLRFANLDADDCLKLKKEALRLHEIQLSEITNGSFSEDMTYVCGCKEFVETCIRNISKPQGVPHHRK